jgi:hypothetical protein
MESSLGEIIKKQMHEVKKRFGNNIETIILPR